MINFGVLKSVFDARCYYFASNNTEHPTPNSSRRDAFGRTPKTLDCKSARLQDFSSVPQRLGCYCEVGIVANHVESLVYVPSQAFLGKPVRGQ
jgi:hypothetical protein